ncbi:MAG: hypothetical protein V3T07_05855 [Myxococcota bacterium]
MASCFSAHRELWRRHARDLTHVTLALTLGCAGAAPVIHSRRLARPEASIGRLAVMPFYPETPSGEGVAVPGASAHERAALITRFLTEAIAARGIDVIPAHDLERAFEGEGQVVPRLDERAAADLAARNFGADAVLLGTVSSYQERSGTGLGSARPASVSFSVTVYSAPRGVALWKARFNETQLPLSENLLRGTRYPRGGTRWLTAAELARWGAGEMAQAFEQALGAAPSVADEP